MDWPTLIETLKAIMQRDGINAQNLAQTWGVSTSTVRNYLALRSRASISTRERIEKFVADHEKSPAKQGARSQAQNTRKQPDLTGKIIDAPMAADAKPHVRGAKGKAVKEAAAKPAATKKNAAKKTATGSKQNVQAEPKTDSKNGKKTAKQTPKASNKQTAKKAQQTSTKADTQSKAAGSDAPKQAAKKPARKQNAKAAKETSAPKQNAKVAAKETSTPKQTAKAAVKAANAPKQAEKQNAAKQDDASANPAAAAKPAVKQTPKQPAPAAAKLAEAKPEAKAVNPEPKEQPAASADSAQQQAANVAPSRAKTPVVTPAKEPNPLRIYVDESFGRIPEKPFTVGMVLASTDLGVMPFKEFTETLYPFGWAPGDEVKAAGKDLANVKNILEGSQNDDIRMFAFRTTTVPSLITVTDDDSTTVAIFPYVSAIINAIETLQRGGLKATSFQIVIDRTNKLPAEAQRVMEKLLSVYFRLSGNKPCSFHITDGDSRAQKGLQLADFVAHFAYVEDEDKVGDFGPVTGVVDDPIGNARRFAFYSGLRLLRLKEEAQTIIGDFKASEAAAEMVAAAEPETVTPDKPMSRAYNYTIDLRNTIIQAQQMGLGGKQLEAVRSRLKGLSTTIANWLLDSQAPLIEGLANRTISDFRQRTVVITRVDKPFQPDSEIGEQQFRIFESQLDKVQELIQSYQSTSED